MPKRIQRRRDAGWKAPEGAVYVGRPTKWGNPFVPVTPSDTPADLVEAFRTQLESSPAIRAAARRELAGRDLMCWCPLTSPCHADVLLAIANGAKS